MPSDGGPHQAPQGDWVGVYGQDRGYYLPAFNGLGSDVDGLDDVTLGTAGLLTHRWVAGTAEVRALESADESTRNAATFYTDPTSTGTISLTFGAAFSGYLRLYCIDWDSTARRQQVTVNDGADQTIALTAAFNDGAWTHFPIDAGIGEAVTITLTNTVGVGNAVLSGLFLDSDLWISSKSPMVMG